MTSSDWLILELNENISPDYKDIEYAIVCMLGEDSDYWIPIHCEKMGSYVSTSVLMEGYIFVKDCPKTRESLASSLNSRMFTKALNKGGRYQTIDSKTIGILKRKLKNSLSKSIQPGSKVDILEGIFKNLTGEVLSIEESGRKVTIKIKRLSREIIAPMPTTSVREIIAQ